MKECLARSKDLGFDTVLDREASPVRMGLPDTPETPDTPELAKSEAESNASEAEERHGALLHEKPSRVSMAPTVHEAVCEDLEEEEEEEDDERQQRAVPEDQDVANEELLRSELAELREAVARELTARAELEALHRQTAERLSSCEAQRAQMAKELRSSKAERDGLRRQLQETSERHVELARRLRKQQETNKQLDSQLNTAEAARLELQNQLGEEREVLVESPEAFCDELIDSSLDSALSKDSPEMEEELPTAGGLLREWASVYEDAAERRPVLLKRSPWAKEIKAEPPMRSPRESAGKLSMRDLSEIKALKKPPPPIRMLMEVCCLLFHIQPVKSRDDSARQHLDYWEPARRFLLSDPFLLSKLRSFEEIGPAQRAKIKKYFKDPDFSAERVLKCSKAAHELYVCVSSLIGLQPNASQSDERCIACTTAASSNENIAAVK
ncbi:unnamed protein product [Effrenium voratum]|uniref:Uncharacterized protein n=1 Tax=Effrenium voratum TaxID=2562239 RepID=A0AA36MU08_9DINO|nr:unnamed protein product [Effrenium voratum]